MKLYEINEEIRRILWQLEPDPETGEVPMNDDELEQQLKELQMKRENVLEYLAKVVLNYRAEAGMLKDEETRLHERRIRIEAKAATLLRILDRECDGVNTPLGVATMTYRKTTRVEVGDAAKAIRWLKRHKFGDCIRVREPEVDKTAVKALLKDGKKVPGVTLEHDRSYNLK